jgi:predicted DNA-binding transcriptional regulator AlpA
MLGNTKNDYKKAGTSYNGNTLGNITNRIFEKLIWGIDDVCRVTTYKKGTIYNLVSCGEIPYRKRRGKLFFIPSEILSWVQND